MDRRFRAILLCVIGVAVLLCLRYVWTSGKLSALTGRPGTGYPLDRTSGLDRLDLYYPAHLLALDGECFLYDVYFQESPDEKKFQEVDAAITRFSEQFSHNGDTYAGYIDVSLEDGRICIFLDLGNVYPDNEMIVVLGILETLNGVSGIEKVLINDFNDYF